MDTEVDSGHRLSEGCHLQTGSSYPGMGRGFYSHYILPAKKTGSFHLIFNLNELNACLWVETRELWNRDSEYDT